MSGELDPFLASVGPAADRHLSWNDDEAGRSFLNKIRSFRDWDSQEFEKNYPVVELRKPFADAIRSLPETTKSLHRLWVALQEPHVSNEVWGSLYVLMLYDAAIMSDDPSLADHLESERNIDGLMRGHYLAGRWDEAHNWTEEEDDELLLGF